MTLEEHEQDVEYLRARIKSLVAQNNALRAKAAAFSRLALSSDPAGPASVWRAMVASPNSRYGVHPTISAPEGTSGVVYYGPYCSLEPGNYTLTLELSCEPGPAAVSDLIGVLEVVYRDVIIARKAVRRSSQTKYTIGFCVSKGAIATMLGEGYEFRLVSTGFHSIEAKDLLLKSDEDENCQNEIFLLDLIRLGSAAQPRKSDFDSIFARQESHGHVFFGPYRSLVPGSYRLSIELLASLPHGAGDHQVVIDVLSENLTLVAEKRCKISNGEQTLMLDFTIPKADQFEHILKSLEFRLEKTSEATLQINKIECIIIRDIL